MKPLARLTQFAKQQAAWVCFRAARRLAKWAEALDVRGEVFTEHGTPRCWIWRDFA